jgi:ribonuclease D
MEELKSLFADPALARRMLRSIAFDAERLNQDGLSPRLTAIQIRDKALLALGTDHDETLRVLRGEHV